MKFRNTIISSLILLGSVSTVIAQASSHKSSAAPQQSNAMQSDATMALTHIEATGKPVLRVNGQVLTDRDVLHEMYTLFPYASQHNGFPKSMEGEIRKGATDMLIFEELVYQEAQR